MVPDDKHIKITKADLDSLRQRITDNNIVVLRANDVFVFGSNLRGQHGAGAAKTALRWGAKMGEGIGHFGATYALPTVGKTIGWSLHTDRIKVYVDQFIEYAKSRPDLTFLVTEVGCGLAGMLPKNIAPMFEAAIPVHNIHLPKRFISVLKKMYNIPAIIDGHIS